jgi:hypothetical protein
VDDANVGDVEVGAQASLGLRPLGERRERDQEPFARVPHVLERAVAVALHDEVLERAVRRRLLLEPLEDRDQRSPAVVALEGRLGELGELGHDRLQQLVEQRVLVGVAAVDGAHADAGARGDVVERRVDAARREHLPRGVEDALAVALAARS